MASPGDAAPVRVALIDDDSGLVTVLDRHFAALRWDREVIDYAAGPDQLAAMRLHAPPARRGEWSRATSIPISELGTGSRPSASKVLGQRRYRRLAARTSSQFSEHVSRRTLTF
ncbi:MAG: hypothetical protein WBP81_21560 [Solirubrobacteraceae bacterium]